MDRSTTERVVENVRAEMARRGLTQSDLGDALGLTQQACSRRLTGRVDFSVSELAEAAELLAVPLQDLVRDQKSRAVA